jgi:hypothetical protein
MRQSIYIGAGLSLDLAPNSIMLKKYATSSNTLKLHNDVIE